MSSRKYKDSEGKFRDWHDAPNHDGNGCCPTPKIRFRHWDSNDGAYVDTFVECQSCGNTYWIDGDDG